MLLVAGEETAAKGEAGGWDAGLRELGRTGCWARRLSRQERSLAKGPIGSVAGMRAEGEATGGERGADGGG